jgi:hypothetical protein
MSRDVTPGNYRPMKPIKADLLNEQYPLITIPRNKGVTCVILGGKALTATLLPIPNPHIRKALAGLPRLHGEIICTKAGVNANSCVRGSKIRDEFKFIVRDCFDNPGAYYSRRLEEAEYHTRFSGNNHLEITESHRVVCRGEFITRHREYMSRGFQSTLAYREKGIHYNGVSTIHGRELIEYRSKKLDVGRILGVCQGKLNLSPSVRNGLGLKVKRFSDSPEIQDSGEACSFLIDWRGNQFKIGIAKGVADLRIRKEIWDEREFYLGQTATFEYQGVNDKGIPILPRYTGLL